YDLLKENYVNIPYNDPWFDVNDLIILANELQNKELSEKLVYNSNDQYEWVNYLFNISSDAKISSSIKDKIMMLLQKSIQYKKFNFFEKMYNELLSNHLKLEIGNLLYRNSYKNHALEIYQDIPKSKLDNQALVNIIELLIDVQQYDNAIEFISFAIDNNLIDYRIFKMGIEVFKYLKNADDAEKLLALSEVYYPRSQYLRSIH